MADASKENNEKKKDDSWKFMQGEHKREKGSGPTGSGAGPKPKKTSSFEYEKGKGWKKVDSEPSSPRSTKVTFVEKTLVDPKKHSGYLGPNAATKGSTDHAKGKASGGLGYYQAGAKSDISYDLAKREANLTIVQAEAKGSVVHGEAEGEFDLGGWFLGLFQDDPKKPAPPGTPGAPGASPMAARVGDLTSHGSPLAPGIGSVNVLIGGMPAWRAAMDFHACPIVKGVVPDVGGVVAVGSPTVLINGMMACRMGDMVVEVPGGPNPIVMGCPTVMIGPAGSGGTGGPGAPGAPAGKETNLKLSGKAAGDVLTAGAAAELGAKWTADEKSAGAKLGAMAAVAKGTIQGDVSIPIPFTDHAITLGAQAEGTLLSAGAEAEASAGWTKGKGFQIKAGAKVGAGLAGGGVSFTIGFK